MKFTKEGLQMEVERLCLLHNVFFHIDWKTLGLRFVGNIGVLSFYEGYVEILMNEGIHWRHFGHVLLLILYFMS